MTTKRELKQRIERLEERVAELEGQPAYSPPDGQSTPPAPWWPRPQFPHIPPPGDPVPDRQYWTTCG